MNKLLFFIVLALLPFGAAAQDDTQDTTRSVPNYIERERADTTIQIRPNLRLVVRAHADSVVLRWGAVDHITWKVAGTAGYIVERTVVQKNKTPEWMRLTPQPLKPLALEEWKARYRAEDTLIGAAVQAWYGKPVVTTDDPFGSIYEMYVQQSNLHGFALLLADADARIADGLALRFVDRTAEKGWTYLYRVYPAARHEEVQIDTAFAIAVAGEGTPVPDVRTLVAAEGEKQVVLRWARYEHTVPFTGYFIEQSFDGGKTFVRHNSIPFVPAINTADDVVSQDTVEYTVALAENYRPVHYRVLGLNAFGETSTGSSVIAAMGRDRTAPKAVLPEKYDIVDGVSIRLKWRLNGEADGDLQGFVVAKAQDAEGPFEPVSPMLGAGERSFVDEQVRDLPQHYYVVTAYDTAGNARSSVPVLGIFPDSIPPAVPTGLTGRVDSTGVVTLTWNSNAEQDLKGYRVFFANQDDHEYMQLTTDITTDTVFTDTLTLKTLSEEIYYKITALDHNFNHSPFTQTLMLKKPDIVLPTAPLITDVTVDEGAVHLQWYASPSSDVVEHTLYRRRVGEEQWSRLAEYTDRTTSYSDSTAETKVLYEYAMDARDDDGLVSPKSNIVNARVYDSGLRAAVERLVCEVDTLNSRIVLKWNYRAAGDYSFYLYKSGGDDSYILLQSVPAGAREFADTEINSGGTYRYGLKVVTDDGGESPMVQTEAVRYR